LTIRKLSKIGRRYRYINRYRQIITILIKYGFEDIINKLKIPQYFALGKRILFRKDTINQSITTEERIRRVFEELGPTFIKFGQIMSTRPDMIPAELVNELKKLQDTIPPFTTEEARKIIKEESGKEVEEIFIEFEENPLASASIAQVHKAKLPDNKEVVIKIQRPGIRKTIEVDLEIMLHLATLLEKYIDEMKLLNPIGIVEEFSRSIEKEIDFNTELNHIQHFADNFKADLDIYVPKVYKELSTDKILILEFISGIRLSQLKEENFKDIDKKVVAARGAELILKQIFVHGFFHADPHPGNIVILENNVICFLDYGMMGYLYGRPREHFSNLLIGIATKDEKIVIRSLLNLAHSTKLDDVTQFERDIHEFMKEFIYKNLSDINFGKMLQNFLNLLITHKYKIRPDFYLLLKTLITYEGIARELDPEYNMVTHLKPFAFKIIKERLTPKSIFDETKIFGLELYEMLKNLPENLNSIISKLKTGSMRIEFEHKGLGPIIKTFEKTYNNLILSIIIAALLISSSLIILSKIPPTWNNIAILGLGGFLFAGFLGLILIYSIFKERK
jgi:ubiquinone biosynthesis protein